MDAADIGIMRKAIKYRLGLDMGANSLGWSVLELNAKNEPCAIVATGSRIFSDGRNVKNSSTLKGERRMARSARRRRDRFKQRQQALMNHLVRAKLFPAETEREERLHLQAVDPLECRAAAVERKLDPMHIGRALFHLNQRRGFKSNRKDSSEESRSGKVSNSISALLRSMELIDAPSYTPEQLKALSREQQKVIRQDEVMQKKGALSKLREDPKKTFGAFLWQRRSQALPTRARSQSDGKLYDFYPSRELLEDEFDKICFAQAKHHPKLLSDQVVRRLREVIFRQRPLKPQARGMCSYMPTRYRAYRALPSVQRYRIYQTVNNLTWHSADGEHRLRDHREARDQVLELFEKPKNKQGRVPFTAIKKILRKLELAEAGFKFNFEAGAGRVKGPDFLEGNHSSWLMQDPHHIGPDWHTWPLAKQDAFVEIILGCLPKPGIDLDERDFRAEEKRGEHLLDDDEVHRHLVADYGLSDQAATACSQLFLDDGVAHVSVKAARMLQQRMCDDMMIQPEAVATVAAERKDFINPSPFNRSQENELWPRLPYYGEAVKGHIIPGDGCFPERGEADDLARRIGQVSNPTVHIALNQLRNVVNELIRRYGHPQSVAIELSRNLPAGKEGRAKTEKRQRDAQSTNERLNKNLRKYDQKPNGANRLRLRLWEALGEPTDRRCPFSGKMISCADLFNGAAEVEHLIPFSQSLDDSNANKVICTRDANRDKGQKTPFEAFGHSPAGYHWGEIWARAQSLSRSRMWRFQKDAREIWEGENGFLARHLSDTQYISRLAREYLEHICPYNKIDVLTGRLTALLRGHWGLHKVLQARAENEAAEAAVKKNRDDHRHHAVDAIVIGMTTQSMLQKVSTAANRAETLEPERLFPKGAKGRGAIDPWSGFYKDVTAVVDGIIVSHRVKRKDIGRDSKRKDIGRDGKTDGQLHNDTAYGIISFADEKAGKPGTEGFQLPSPSARRAKVVSRRPIAAFTTRAQLESIRGRRMREQFLHTFDSAHDRSAGASAEKVKAGIAACAEYAQRHQMRRLRYTQQLTVIPIKDKSSGEPYKGYKGDSNWGMEIYEYPSTHKKSGQWVGVVISRYDANQHTFKPGQTFRPHPAAKLLMRLHINDYLHIKWKGAASIFRVQKISDGEVSLAAPHEANVDKRTRDSDDQFKYLRKSVNQLRVHHARKVHISPAGCVSGLG